MNSLLLLLIAILAAAFGYRFYAKLLAVAVYGLDDNYSTPARERPDAHDRVPTNPHFLFGHHAAAIAGLTVVGAALAVAWGWVPVFLWVVAGTVVGAGAFGMAGLWLSVRRPAAGLYAQAREFSGRAGAVAFVAVGMVLLVTLNACAAILGAWLLTAYPGAVLPLVALVFLGIGLGRYLHGRRESALPGASFIALVLLLIAIHLLHWPISYDGVLQLTLGDTPLLTLDAIAAWAAVLLVYAVFAARAPIWQVSRPRSHLTTLLALVALGICYAGLAITHPALTAPELHAAADTPYVFPWLFVALAGGTLVGFQFIVASGVTAPQLKREGHARYLGYGGALLDGLLALAVVIIAATAFTDAAAWRDAHTSWSRALDIPRAVTQVIEGIARYGAAVGVSEWYGRSLAALVFIGLSVATLEAGMRSLKRLLAEAARATPADKHPRLAQIADTLGERRGSHVAFWISLLTAVAIGRDLAYWWLLFGSVNLLFAGLALLLAVAALRAAARPALLLWGPASFALVLAGWALALTAMDGLLAGRWLHAMVALALLTAGAVMGWQSGRRLRRIAPHAAPPGA